MASLNAEAVAKDVIKTVRSGKKVHLGKIIRKNGYSKAVSICPTKVTQTKTYQRVVMPLIKQLERERQAILDRLPEVRNDASYRDLTDGLDKMTKNIQLLSGRSTENIAVSVLSEDEMAKLDFLLNDKQESTSESN